MTVPNRTIVAIATRLRHSARAKTNNANHTLMCCGASTNNQHPASTNHVVGSSAEGYAPYSENSGDNANRKLAAIPARQPNALPAIPVINTNETNRSTVHCTVCTVYAEGALLNL